MVYTCVILHSICLPFPVKMSVRALKYITADYLKQIVQKAKTNSNDCKII